MCIIEVIREMLPNDEEHSSKRVRYCNDDRRLCDTPLWYQSTRRRPSPPEAQPDIEVRTAAPPRSRPPSASPRPPPPPPPSYPNRRPRAPQPSPSRHPSTRERSRRPYVTRNTGVEFTINIPGLSKGRGKKEKKRVRIVDPPEDDDGDDVDYEPRPQPGPRPPPPPPPPPGYQPPGPPPIYPDIYPPPYQQHVRPPPVIVQAAPRAPNEPEIVQAYPGPGPAAPENRDRQGDRILREHVERERHQRRERERAEAERQAERQAEAEREAEADRQTAASQRRHRREERERTRTRQENLEKERRQQTRDQERISVDREARQANERRPVQRQPTVVHNPTDDEERYTPVPRETPRRRDEGMFERGERVLDNAARRWRPEDDVDQSQGRLRDDDRRAPRRGNAGERRTWDDRSGQSRWRLW
ncbi:MAG: hypothetical protein M1816_004299 [Peltula sp. TS41687]|nr:MAG: hypothetical protein M1816_004299 [Peltula sp. TS41687]